MASEIKKMPGFDAATIRLASSIPFALPAASAIASRTGGDVTNIVTYLANPTPHVDAYKSARADRTPADTFLGRLKERAAYATARSDDLTRESLLTNDLTGCQTTLKTDPQTTVKVPPPVGSCLVLRRAD